MQPESKIFDHLKQAKRLDSDAALMDWLGISRDSLSGIRTGRLPMGDSIRFQILNRWWSELRPQSVGAQPAVGIQHLPLLNAESLLNFIESRYKNSGDQSLSIDAQLLEAYKRLKGFKTDAEYAAALGVKRHSISMVRSGKNGLGPIPLLKIFEEVLKVSDIGLQEAVKSSHALLNLIQPAKITQ